MANIHPFPARMASDLASAHLKQIASSAEDRALTIVDPMCGSGTVIRESVNLGFNALGFDMDPLAVLMSRVSTNSYDSTVLMSTAKTIESMARKIGDAPALWDDEETQEFAEFWFGEKQREQLSRLSIIISEMETSNIKDALGLALSRLIDTKSPKASLASDTSHSRPHRTISPEDNDYNVYDGFLASVKRIAKLLDHPRYPGNAEVKLGDARKLNIPDGSVGAVITSPPYLNAIDYLRGHRLSLIWLGYSIPELRAIRSDSIGANRAISASADERVLHLVECIKQDEENISDISLLPIKMLQRYAYDLLAFSSEIKRICKAGASVVIVIGNSSIKGNFIRNDLLMEKALEAHGVRLHERATREIPDSSRYLPIRTSNQDSSLHRRMREEVVLLAYV